MKYFSFEYEDNKNVTYFIDYVTNFFEKINYGNINIFTGRQIMEEVIVECNGNALKKNENNNKMLNKKIDDLCKNKYLLDKVTVKKLNYLKQKIFEKESDIVLPICRNIKNYFESKTYFDFLVDNLLDLLKDKENDNSCFIAPVVDTLFVELRNNGSSYESTRNKIGNLLAVSELLGDKSKKLNTMFPYYLIPNYKSKTSIQLNDYINKLDVYDRLAYIKKLYNIKEETFYLIVPIKGIVVDNSLEINNEITLYNPEKDDIVCNRSILSKMGLSDIDYNQCCNACIKVKTKCIDLVYEIGLKKIENFLNLQLLISNNINGYKIITTSLIVLNSEKKDIGFKHNTFENIESEKNFIRENNPVDAKDFLREDKLKLNNLISKIIYTTESQSTKTDLLLTNSIKKYSDALNNDDNQEAILKYWSSIESLFCEDLVINGKNQAYDLIEEVLSIYISRVSFIDTINQLFRDIFRQSNLYPLVFVDSYKTNYKLNISNDVIDYIKNKKGEVSRRKFLDKIGKIKDSVDRTYYLNELNYLDDLCNDKSFARRKFNDVVFDYKDKILNIYRLRNQIIHNALSNDITTEYYLKVIKRISSSFLFDILKKYSENNSLTINQIILELYSEANMFVKEIEEVCLKDILL